MLPVPVVKHAQCTSTHKGFQCERSTNHNTKSGTGRVHRYEQMRWTSSGRDHVTRDYYPPKVPRAPKVRASDVPEHYTEADYQTWMRL